MNLAEALRTTATNDPDRIALVGPEPVTHAALHARAAAAAGRRGPLVAPGARVDTIAGTEPAFVAASWATLRTGAIAVPLNTASPSHELARQLDAVTPAIVIASPGHADLARRAVA